MDVEVWKRKKKKKKVEEKANRILEDITIGNVTNKFEQDFIQLTSSVS